MKKFLPTVSIKYLVLSVLGFLVLYLPIILNTSPLIPTVHADNTTTVSKQDAQTLCGPTPLDNCYVPDNDVGFVARNAVRSKDLLNWVLDNYRWDKTGTGTAIDFGDIWKPISYVVYGTLGLFVLVAAFLLIITRGKSLTVRKFIPRFIFVVVLVFLSFSIVQFLYQVGDVVQQFVLTSPNDTSRNISDSDLLSIGFKYDDPSVTDYQIGFRKPESKYDEQVFTTVIMTKLTAISYYAMFGILMIRKIILWFFLIISPIFPVLLLFALIRNTAKLWIGEFFRWLLYAPLFALFLKGLVELWKGGIGFACNPTPSATATSYPTATDILLGGPCQSVGVANNLNTPETFIQYVVALIMLWLVIVLPFVLLKIFLDYVYNSSFVENNIVKYLASTQAGGVLNRYGGSALAPSRSNSPTPPLNPPPTSTGLARNLPSFEHSPLTEIQKNMAQTAKEQQSIIGQTSIPTSASLARDIENKVSSAQRVSAPANAGISAATSSTNQSAMNIENSVAAAQRAAATNIANQSTSNLASEATSRVAANIEQNANANTNSSGASAITSQAAQTLVNTVISNEEARNESISNLYPRLEAAFDRAVVTVSQPVAEASQNFKQALTEIFNATNLSIPTLKDIARYDSEVTLKEASDRQETSKVSEIINRIAGTSPIATPAEKQQYAGLREKLVTQSQKGNALAHSILSASVPQQAEIHETNLVQQVSIEDYEQVKKMWKENYSKSNPPIGPDGKPEDRKAWLQEEVKKIPEVIDLLLSGDPQKVAQGKSMVSKILPFLLLGGFSKAEIIAYLKAKLAAAKEVLNEALDVEKDEDTKLDVEQKPQEKPKTMEAEEEIPSESAQPQATQLPESDQVAKDNLSKDKDTVPENKQ